MAGLGLNIGLKALLSSRAGLDTVGHNIANANTPGYSRQRAELSASPSILLRGLALGNGVDTDEILRTADALLHRRLVAQTGAIAQIETRLAGMSQVESLLGEPGDNGLAELLKAFSTRLGGLAASPDDAALAAGAVQSSLSLTARFNELSSSFSTARRDNGAAVTDTVRQVNTLAAEVSKLNTEIATFEKKGVAANDLRDQRDESLKALASLTAITYSERPSGAVTVSINGALLIGESRSYKLRATVTPEGAATVTLENHPRDLEIKGGKLGGLLRVGEEFVPSLASKLDALAKNLILETNRAHSTGVPSDGAFHALTGSYAVEDKDGDGVRTDELLANSGLPFDPQAGQLFVNITDESTGRFTTHSITIDPAETTVADLIDRLNAIPHLNAGLDSTGKLQVTSRSGFGFDFSRRLNGSPDVTGTFGGNAATLGTTIPGPFNLADGDTLSLTGPGGTANITFDDADFADITQATAEEIVAVLESTPALAASGLSAVAVGGRLMLQTDAQGAGASVTVGGGTSLAAFGWSAAQVATGQDNPVEVAASGKYTGTRNEEFTFVPNMDGTIGTTAGLEIAVYDSSGAQVATLDVGDDYEPGTSLALPSGLAVSFGFGSLSASSNQAFSLHALADSDTSDVLVSFGLNSYFTGTSAADIDVRADIQRDPSAIASTQSGAAGDNATIRDMLAAQTASAEGLGGSSIESYWSDAVSGLGFEISAAESAREVDRFLLDSLTARRDEISGVNVDEELVDMIRFEQAFSAASRYIAAVNATNDEIMNLI
jgi:flagellar hook-associated protein FlgK